MIPADFFPNSVSYYFTTQQMGVEALSANEMAVAKNYGTKRFADFCTGRYCLRKSTEALQYTGDILIGERGMPLLPNYIAASISHSKNLCGAVASHKKHNLSLGIDIETNGRVHEDMWRLLFTQREIEWLLRHDKKQTALISTIFFSLKEAFYKLQYPLTGVYLDFPEVEIEVVDEQYYAILLKHVNDEFTTGKQIPGKVLQLNNEIITYCSLPVL
jgi:4'-phosphopantetheinyl transferase EntD